jgi:rhodanese-related sulfurtransferase
MTSKGTGKQGLCRDVDPSDAYAGLQSDPDAVLLDVRTTAEWSYVGLPDLTQVGMRVIFPE